MFALRGGDATSHSHRSKDTYFPIKLCGGDKVVDRVPLARRGIVRHLLVRSTTDGDTGCAKSCRVAYYASHALQIVNNIESGR